MTGDGVSRGTVTDPGVAAHYRRWPFPGVEHGSREGLILLRTVGTWLEASSGSGRVADVGCGTGHTVIALARHFPEVEFVGLDLVEEVLEAAWDRAREAQVETVRFVQGDLNRPLTGLGEFHVVLCLGVLHHLPDLSRGFDSSCSLLGPGGHLVLWLYGKHGRERHRLNQEFLRVLGNQLPGAEQLSLARAFVESLGARFAVDTGFYTPQGSGPEGIGWLLQHPEWLADQMVPALEQSVTLHDILSLFEGRGVTLEKWLGVDPDPKAYTTHPLLLERLEQLSPEQRLLAIDLLIKPAYYFVAGVRRSEAGGRAI